MEGETSLQEMMKLLIEDRRKREEEIAAERKRREEEIAAERKRQQDEFNAERTKREEERKAREKEMQTQMDDMRAQMDKLMKVVETTAKTEAKPAVKELSVKLVPLSEKDDIEAYLVTFERIMEAHKIKQDNWSQNLAPQLTGKAQLAFAALPTEDSGKYAAIKTAILARYDITEEAYRRRFRTATCKDGETNRELTLRLMDMQNKWLKKCSTVAEMQEVIGIEQFLNTLPMEKPYNRQSR